VIKEIITDEDILSKPCEPATAADAEVAQDLVDTLLANEEAAALAANQIGVTKAIVAYLNEKDRPVVMYNPQITQALKPFPAVEACLSREEAAAVTRYKWIRVSYDVLLNGELMPRKKKMEGWQAQLVQHQPPRRLGGDMAGQHGPPCLRPQPHRTQRRHGADEAVHQDGKAVLRPAQKHPTQPGQVQPAHLGQYVHRIGGVGAVD